MSRSAKTSGCRSRRRATRRWPAPRCWSTSRPATSPSARPRCAGCCAAASRRAPVRPMPTRRRAPANRPPTSPGTARPRSSNAATSSPNRSASRRTRPSCVADVDLGRIRQERLRNGGFADNAAMRGRQRSRASAASSSRSTRRRQRGARARRSSASPTCRPIPPSCATIATRPTTSRSRAWRSGCSRAASENAVIGVSGGLDSTQALIVSCRAMDLLGLPRKQHPRLHDAGLRHLGQNPQATPGG